MHLQQIISIWLVFNWHLLCQLLAIEEDGRLLLLKVFFSWFVIIFSVMISIAISMNITESWQWKLRKYFGYVYWRKLLSKKCNKSIHTRVLRWIQRKYELLVGLYKCICVIVYVCMHVSLWLFNYILNTSAFIYVAFILTLLTYGCMKVALNYSGKQLNIALKNLI